MGSKPPMGKWTSRLWVFLWKIVAIFEPEEARALALKVLRENQTNVEDLYPPKEPTDD